MKIVMTNTADHTRKVVSFDEVCNLLNGHYTNRAERRKITFRLLSNEAIKYNDIDGDYEFKREIN